MQTCLLVVAFLFTLTTHMHAQSLTLTADAPDGLIIGDRPSTVTLLFKDRSSEGNQFVLHQQFVDRYGKVTELDPIEFTHDWDYWRTVDVPTEFYGPSRYRVQIYRKGQDTPYATAEEVLIRTVPQPQLTDEQRFNSSIGVNNRQRTHWQTLAAMGIHWVRDYSWYWMGIDDSAPMATPDFPQVNFHDIQREAADNGIFILPCMQQIFRTPDKLRFIDDADKIAASYKRYSEEFPDITHWELDNEADLRVPQDQRAAWFDNYADYIVAADKGLDAAGHGAKTVLNGDAGIHPYRLQWLIDKVGDHFDTVSYHYYTGTAPPETARHDTNTGSETRERTISFLDQLVEINRIAKAADKETWFTEIAWSAHTGPAVSERLQSAYAGRIYMVARWAGTDKTFWFWDRNIEGNGRFSGTGLIDDEQGAMPVGAAFAAVSKFTAATQYVGSVDLGPDRWCLVFERPEGGYVVSAWCIDTEAAHDLPKPLAAAEEIYGMYGNPLRERKITAEPLYAMLDTLPDDWAGQLDTEWTSPRIVNIYPGDTAAVSIDAPDGATLSYDGLPSGVTVGERTLTAEASIEPGEYEVSANVSHDGWTKAFPLIVKVRQAVDITSEPYTPGEASQVSLALQSQTGLTAELSAAHGTFEPASVSLEHSEAAGVTFSAADDATGPVEAKVALSNGVTQTLWLRPRHLTVPRASKITTDADLTDWPDGGAIRGHALNILGPNEGYAPTLRFAWSDDGLHVAGELPITDAFESSPEPAAFWEWTSMEMVLTNDKGERHHLWFAPTGEGDALRIFAGEWEKPMPDGGKQTIRDDNRPTTAIRRANDTLTIEILIPYDVLGGKPSPGDAWQCVINAKDAKAHQQRTVAQWPAGGPGQWNNRGVITFE